MIKLTPTSSSSITQQYFHTKDTVQAVNKIEVPDICDAGLYCDIPIPVFADETDTTNKRKNDFRSFIIKVPNSSTVTGTLTYLEDGTTYNIIGNTYGVFFSLNTLDTNVWGFVLDWLKVAQVIGYGCYKFNITVKNSSLTEIYNQDSPCFDLKPFSCSAAFDTVRINTVQTGYIESGFDYSNIKKLASKNSSISSITDATDGWPQQLRWYGKLKRTTPTTNKDNIVDNDRTLLNTQTQIIDNYDLRLNFIHRDVSEHFLKDQLLASPVVITDYNEQKNNGVYRDVQLSYVEVGERTGNNKEFFNIKLVEYKQNNIIRYE